MNVSAGLSDTTEASIGREVAHCLNLTQRSLPNDVTERLRVARLNAVDLYRRQHRVEMAHQVQSVASSALALSGDRVSGWNWLGSALPVLVLVLGLLSISEIQDQSRALESATVDVALLTDELPPHAYSDPGFIRFVKMQDSELNPNFNVQ